MTTGKKGIFLDTFFIQALLNHRDHFHVKAKALFQQVMSRSLDDGSGLDRSWECFGIHQSQRSCGVH